MLPLVVTVESPNGQVRRYAFADSPVRVGRSPFAELQLTEAFVSRWEGTLRFDEREITYFHVSSTNPTYIDGRVAGVHEEVVIGPDTVLALGELKLRFARTVVAEQDLRRKGKRRPIKSDDETVAKTVWLDASRPIDPNQAGPVQTSSSPPPPKERGQQPISQRPVPPPESVPTAEAALPVDPRGSDPGRNARLTEREVRVLQARPISNPPPSTTPTRPDAAAGLANARPGDSNGERFDSGARSLDNSRHIGRPGPMQHSERPVIRPGDSMRPPSDWRSPSDPPGRPAPVRPGLDKEPTGSTQNAPTTHPGTDPAPVGVGTALDGLYASYRSAWGALLVELSRKLDDANDTTRAQLADQFQRRYPQITQEPEFRSILKRYRLEARKPEIPEIGEWLHNVAQGVLPPKFRLDTGLTLERILALLEMLTQSFAEINDAQDSIRKHWLGRAPRTSLLRSDNGRVILAYLLNPKAEWSERLGELEDAIREVVMHELSLFKATLEGARDLLESMSPEALAQAEGIELEALDEEGGAGFWNRILPRDLPEGRLWRRFVQTYEGLKDGDRYQRLFLGRSFARTYLAAMGQRDSSGNPAGAPGGDER